MRLKAFSRKPRSLMSSMRDPILPAVKRVCLVVDADFIRECLKKRKLKDFDNLKWPEAEKAMYRKAVDAENKLMHIISCCDKALNENVRPLKDYMWNRIVAHSCSKEV
jgi:hypothetical protein